jgi:hypothetical protein
MRHRRLRADARADDDERAEAKDELRRDDAAGERRHGVGSRLDE